MSRHNYAAIHETRYEQIKPYVSFKLSKNPTAYEKRKIKHYYDELKPHISRASTTYRPRKKENIERAIKETGLRVKQLKAFPIDAPAIGNVKVSFPKKGGMNIKHKYGDYTITYFDGEKLALDPEGHILDLTKDDPDSPTYVLKCGDHLSRKNFNGKNGAAHMAQQVQQWQEDYDNEESPHYWQKWMVGYEVHNFENRTSRKDFIRERRNQTIDKRTRIKNVEQKIKRDKGLKKNKKRKY